MEITREKQMKEDFIFIAVIVLMTLAFIAFSIYVYAADMAM